MSHPLALTIDEVKGSTVVAKDANGHTFLLPASAIVGNPEKGKQLRLIARTTDDGPVEPSLARDLLNELLS
ncbi:MAG: hypothetical protein Q7R83_03020 [bacterium]|nr:hypothetical protein [bacterium]